MKKKLLSMLLCLCMAFGLFLAPVQTAKAAVNEDVLEACKGILEVLQVITVDGNEIGGYRGTGFLIGTDENAQHIITNHHVVNGFPHEEKAIRKLLQENGIKVAKDAKVKSEIRVIVKRDVYLTAEIVNQSEVGDFCILKMEQPIYDRAPLTLGDSSKVATTQSVYALGFPSAVEGAWGSAIGESLQLDAIYTAEDVTVTSGTVSKVGEFIGTGASISTIVHSATLSGGNSGGPLVTTDGQVVGINTYGVSETAAGYYYSTEINEVTSVLSALGIAYKSGDAAPVKEVAPETEASAPETTAPAVNAEKLKELENCITVAEAVALEKMTAESVANFNIALRDAKDVLSASAPTEAEIDEAIANLNTAKTGLVEEKADNTMMIVVAGVAAVVVIIIVVLVVTSSGKKKKEQEAAAQKAAAQRAQQRAQQSAGNTGNTGWNQQRPSQSFNPAPVAEGSDETSVLSDGANETTVLGASIPSASLIRKKNNERVSITKAVFKIGKERRKVDYCISDNTNISRSHADIVYKNGAFYIVDNNATNGQVRKRF